jgi:hypothetical protein
MTWTSHKLTPIQGNNESKAEFEFMSFLYTRVNTFSHCDGQHEGLLTLGKNCYNVRNNYYTNL